MDPSQPGYITRHDSVFSSNNFSFTETDYLLRLLILTSWVYTLLFNVKHTLRYQVIDFPVGSTMSGNRWLPNKLNPCESKQPKPWHQTVSFLYQNSLGTPMLPSALWPAADYKTTVHLAQTASP